MRKSLIAGLVVLAVAPAAAGATQPVKIDDLVVAGPLTPAKRAATVKAARAFYQFWNTGEDADLKAAIADSFIDHTLPAGRPQGPEGPVFASRHFRAAVPDLSVEVVKMVVAGDYVTVHMQFRGHFTGVFGEAHEAVKGQGQAIDFIATDLIRVRGGRVTDNWHIEDNLTLLSKMGVARVGR